MKKIPNVIYGVSCGFHNAALASVHDKVIAFAAEAERYSRVKNDPLLNQDLVDDCIRWNNHKPGLIVYYENRWKKALRQMLYGQPSPKISPYKHIKQFFPDTKIVSVGHHHSHAAAGYYTAPFGDAAVIVIDAIGEFDTMSVWVCDGFHPLTCVHRTKYPHSLGLLYSAFTDYVDLKPNEEEYILMGMAAYGRPVYAEYIKEKFLDCSDPLKFRLKENVHLGIGDAMEQIIVSQGYTSTWKFDIAASIQAVLEEYLLALFKKVAWKTKKSNVVFSGGVALNCLANTKIAQHGVFDDMWIMPAPGDAGSALGAILAYTGKPVRWEGPYLGHEIGRDSPFDTDVIVDTILQKGIVGLASGRAEFGPRAFGNRSLLADPRPDNMKGRVNKIKQRQEFRPFAPIVLYEHANAYFEIPYGIDCSYMQYAVKCKRRYEIPAVCHVDGTSRVQVLHRLQNPVMYSILEKWYRKTNCPVLLNTSLNIRGEPLVNTAKDAEAFLLKYNVPVFY